jgi:transcriptional regulator GlxA family with amidase domain
MNAHHRPVTVALLATPQTSAATLYGFYDALCGVRRDWQMLHGGPETASPFRPLVVSADGRPLVAGNGVRVTPDASFDACPRPDVAVVTDLMIAPGTPLDGLLDAETAWLRGAFDAGATLACACSGALLVARTGLLDGHDATSHWAYCDLLAKEYPRVRWQPERGLIVAGPGQRVLMAGSGVAWHMLSLALIARFASPEDAMQVARINLIDLGGTSALSYASLTRGPRAADGLIARCQVWAASNYRCDSPVAQMASLSGLSERTFTRRFSQAVGMSPLEYIHTLRLEEAKQMLEATDLPVEAVAFEVGYQDTSFFGRLFRRKVTLTPAQYRKRFGALGAQLRRAAAADDAPQASRAIGGR